MKHEIKVYKHFMNNNFEVKAIIRNAWLKYIIDPRNLKYKNVYLRNVDERFNCEYWFSEYDLGKIFGIDVSTLTLKDVATTINNAIEDAKSKIDCNIKNKTIVKHKKSEKYIMTIDL